MARHTGNTTTDHDTIRKWAEERGARPACVKGTGGNGDPGMIRLDFPGFSGAESLQPISWDEWFESFDDNDLALVYQDRTASGQKSNFNKLIGRDTAKARARGDNAASRHHGTRKKTASRSRSTSRAKSSSGRSHTAGSSNGTRRSKSTSAAKSGAKRGTRAGTRSSTRGTGTRSSRSTTSARGSRSTTRGSTRRGSSASTRSGSRSRSSTRSSGRSSSRRSSSRTR